MFGPLNIKTDYSLLSSLIKVDDLICFLKENKLSSCGICDNNLSSSIEFYNKCILSDIKPIIGLDILFNDKHLYLYATNYEGYKNLLKINTFYEHITVELLKKYANDIICVLTKSAYNLYNDLNFFSKLYLAYTFEDEKQKAILLTNNIVYMKTIKCFKKSDCIFFKYLNMLGGTNNIEENSFYELPKESDYESIEKFSNLINIIIPKNKRYIPKYKENVDSFKFLSLLAHEGLNKRLNNKKQNNYYQRLEYELNIINKMGFVDYFLIVYDYTLYAKKHNCLVGPGRGSAAGSLVCYAIGITDIDPIKYNLMFERFLNPERVTMPDIDIDFESTKRDLIIDYVKNKYGINNVASGLTYNTMKTKLVLRDVCKILKINDSLINKFMKVINGNKTLKENLIDEKVKKYLSMYEELNNVYKIAIVLEGLKKNISTHAAGIVISSINLDEIIPVINNNGNLITGITMDYLEDLGLLKMDFLALRNLTIIANILNKLNKNVLKAIDLNDENVINLFTQCKTDGIFQYETSAMKKLLSIIKPKSFNDLVSAVALVRPGPSNYVNDFVLGKEGKKEIKYLDPCLVNILNETYGVILYQEQIISILEVMGGFTKAEADIIRRAISKKKDRLIISSKEKFIKGAIKKGIKENIAISVYDDIIKFSGYGFNKSHSVSYALIGYQMAYLKYYYPAYFINELLIDNKSSSEIQNYLLELKQNNVMVQRPDINYSLATYDILDKKVILPLSIIKGITKEQSLEIVNNKPYKDLFEFVTKNNTLNKKVLETLIYAQALNSLNINIKTLIENIDVALNYASLGLNDESLKPIITKYDEYDEELLRSKEIELFGFYVSNHPASKYQDKSITKLNNIQKHLFVNATFIVIIENIKNIKTKKGDDMAFIRISDETDTCDAIAFSNIIPTIKTLNVNDLVLIKGTISKSFDKTRIIINNIIKEKNRKQ